MKYLFLTAFVFVLYLVGRHFVHRKIRALRGEPEPDTSGPRNITLVALAIVLVYGVWIAIRLFRG